MVEPHTFLEFADIFLYAVKKNFALDVLVWAEGQRFSTDFIGFQGFTLGPI